MATREERIQIINETLGLCNNDPILRDAVRGSIKDQRIYWGNAPLDVPAPKYGDPAQLLLRSERTIEAVKEYIGIGKKVAVLNFASSVSPGGGVLKGSSAQEESICRVSSLYPALSDPSVSEFYRRHLGLISEGTLNGKNTDDCIYTPGIVAIRKDDHDCDILSREERFSFDVITCAAPDLRHHSSVEDYRPAEEELYRCFLQRIGRILQVAAINAVDVLILGAFGCGAFRNDPKIVSRAFYEALCCDDNMHRFEIVKFAVPYNPASPANYESFAQIPGIKTAPD